MNDDSVRELSLYRWLHLALVHPASSKPSLYIDGGLDKTNAYSAVPAVGTTPIEIRSSSPYWPQPRATLDEVAIYAKALTATQVLDHYKIGSTAP